ncbi:formin-like protein 6 [Rutidosis leptorrhynchoides]|uniref:formin-like protein 6 n=1 Tax=Rutidosis leptorrhynchoides TaxID=125765 RepID=UPI003A9999AD
MKHHYLLFTFLFIPSSLFTSITTTTTTIHRRNLHQPLFPVGPTPPPPPPTPPSPTTTDNPFFHQTPNGQTQNTSSPPPPPPAGGSTAANTTAATHPTAPQPAKPAKKIAVVISVGIVTLGMLSALAFFIYKHKSKQQSDSRKLINTNSFQDQESRNLPPSSFLYIGTVEPSRTVATSESTTTINDGSPYNKLNSIKRSDRYRPSPELQPLPPLTKPQPPPPPPVMSSSDEEEEYEESNDFYTPHGSTASTDDGFSIRSLNKRTHRKNYSSNPHSKRTSPRSRLSISSSPDTPSKNQFPADSPANESQPAITNGPRRAKFSAPPPGADMTRLHSDDSRQKPRIPVPPPPPLTAPDKIGAFSGKRVSMGASKQPLMKTESMSPRAKVIPKIVKTTSFEDVKNDEFEENDGSKPLKLKPLHWDKVRATSDRATVWDQLKSSSFHLNEDIMESLFGCNSGSSAKKEDGRNLVVPPSIKENRVLDPKKSQNIAILLKALNVTQEVVSEALLEGSPNSLGAEVLETLVKMAPTKEEEIKLKDYTGDISKLGSAERFVKEILNIPSAFKRVEAMLYRANFDNEVNYLRSCFQTLETASEELKNSRLFLKLLEAVLRAGNRMNVGTNRGEATAFKLDTLLKLVDIKGTDGKTTLLHFVVQEIIRSEGIDSKSNSESYPAFNEGNFKKQGLQIVTVLGRELNHIKKAAGMDSDVLCGYVSKLETGLQKIRLIVNETQENKGNFFGSMRDFIKEAELELVKIKIDEKKALAGVKEVTEYFHGDNVKEGVYPLRIFTIVRDFLGILDHVCKEVGQMQDRVMVGSARSFRVPISAPLPVMTRYNVRRNSTSSDEESSYSSPR